MLLGHPMEKLFRIYEYSKYLLLIVGIMGAPFAYSAQVSIADKAVSGTSFRILFECQASYTCVSNVNGSSRYFSSGSSYSVYDFGVGTFNIYLQAYDLIGGRPTMAASISDTITISVSNSPAVNKKITYEYDELGRLVSVLSPDGSDTTYEYDNADNRMSKTVE